MLLSQQLATTAQKAGAQPVLHYLGKDLRYSEFTRKVAQLSYLYQNELGQFARVAVLASNCPAVVATFFALSNSRSVLIPIDPTQGFEEIGRWLRESEATHLAISSDRTAMARDLLRSERLHLPVIEIEKKMGGEYDQSFTPLPESPPKDSDPVLLLRTAGVSGPPRLAAFDHVRVQAAVTAIRGAYRATGKERFSTPLNWSHPLAFVHAMVFPVLSGNTCVVDPGTELKELPTFLRESKVTRLVIGAEGARGLLNFCRETGARLGSVKALSVGLSSVSPELETLAADTSIALLRCYGQTENVWTLSLDDFTEIGQHPRPWPRALTGLRYKVLDGNGDEIAGKQERTGQLAVSGPTVMLGYRGAVKKDCETATKMRLRGTWLYTGDIATLAEDKEGVLRVRLEGRREQLLESGRSFISPEAIDAAIRKIPGCLDGAGFVTHDLQQKPLLACAYVKEENRLLRPHEVLEQLRQLLSGEEVPLAVVAADSIPRTLAGVNRPRLARQFSGISPTEIPASSEAAANGPGEATPVASSEAPSFETPAAPAPAGLSPEEELAQLLAEPLPGASPAAPATGNAGAGAEGPRAASPRPAARATEHFLTFDLDRIVANETLPANLYLYLEGRFVVYIPQGGKMSRVAYDRLQFRRVSQLFVREADIARMRTWAAGFQRGGGDVPADQSPEGTFRKKIREHAFELFQSPRADERVTKTLEASRKLLDEVISAPYSVKALHQLQSLAGGTVDHSINVSMLSVYLGLQMGYSHQLILQHLGAGALLHDFGKALLDGREDEGAREGGTGGEAWPAERLREHPRLGARSLAEGNAPKEVIMIVEQHHECHDGSGYPQGLRGSAIYDLARIVAIANVFDNLVSEGQGELKARQREALRRLESEQRAKFDPQKLAKAVRILGLCLKEGSS
ncbi:MAG: AMP-binding protein [Oligoflexia bacterium]|nr:AMP-binding protein [Oligoflexia bacterium]